MDGKYTFWGMVLAALITVAGSVYIYNGKEELKKQEKKQNIERIKKEQKDSKSTLKITKVFLPPIATELDSIFFTKISNISNNPAKDLVIKINFGETKISKCEIKPKGISKSEIDSSILEYKLKELKSNDDLFIYCHLSNPIFNSLLINGSNLSHSLKFTFLEYKNEVNYKSDNNKETGFYTFYKLTFTLIGLAILIYLLRLIKKLIDRKFEL